MSIGTVLSQLRDEFPEVTISKIRFLEAEGLVEPQRTPSGYRKFSPEDVERLAQVLRMQRDHYLPLKVIREHLDALARGEQVRCPRRARAAGAPRRRLRTPDAGAADRRPGGPGRAAGRRRGGRGGAGRVGVVRAARRRTTDGGYDAEAVTVARLVADLGRFGLEPRHLRAMKAAADREAGLVEQVVAPLRRHRNPQTRAHAEATTKELAALSVRLHAALVQTALRGPAALIDRGSPTTQTGRARPRVAV